MFGKLGPTELLVIFAIVLLVFGPSALPKIGQSIGKGIREFRQATRDVTGSLEDAASEANKE